MWTGLYNNLLEIKDCIAGGSSEIIESQPTVESCTAGSLHITQPQAPLEISGCSAGEKEYQVQQESSMTVNSIQVDTEEVPENTEDLSDSCECYC